MISIYARSAQRVGILGALALCAFVLSWVFPPYTNLSAFFLWRQDCWLLLLEALLLILIARLARPSTKPIMARGWWPWAVSAGLLGLCLAGHLWILDGYDLSRDEQMANFDAWVFMHGHLVQPLPPVWRDHADALNTLFMYDAPHRSSWISTYLPFNALLRAGVGAIATPALTGGLLTGAALLALWGCVRRLWPQDREAPVLALLMFVTSGQILVTGMTAYAMPGHLAFNLIWLWLFLRCSLVADLAAILVGFVAMGLHQPLMHPLFAGPFLLLLWQERHWKRLALFVAGYGLGGAFWLWWPGHIWQLAQAAPHGVRPAGVDFLTRLWQTLAAGDARGLQDTLANLLRFVAWQNLALLPLMVLGWRVVRHDRFAGALALSVVLTVCVMALILPYQGHGFGYRYLHGLIGNCILLAMYGWRSLRQKRDVWRTILLRAAVVGGLVIVPLQFWMAHMFYTPMASASARIARLNADYVVIGVRDAPFSADLVYNQPDLANRPLRLLAEQLNKPLIARLCASHARIVVPGDELFTQIDELYSITPYGSADRRKRLLETELRATGCIVE